MKSKLFLALFLIFLVVNFPVSNNYILGEIFNLGEVVSAQDVTLNCCLETTDGAVCQDLVSTNSQGCKTSLLATTCENTANCNFGCCVDEEEGLCATNSPKNSCEDNNGTWVDDESCLITECQRGCCVLGNNAQFVPEKRCEVLSLVSGFEKDFRNINTELECLLLVMNSSDESCVGDNCNISERRTCVDEEGKERKDGESWCSYDGFIGEGKDTVGSRHWRQSCSDSEIVNEGCSDYRGQICVQSEIEESGETFSMASCIMNTALQCIQYNEEEDMSERCQEDKMCMIKNINVDSGFKFDVCVGRYSRGLDLLDQGDVDDALCSVANQKCVVTYQKGLFGGWKCKNNCNCEKKVFTQEMNDFCVSLGDCGSYVNYKGVGTDNIRVNNAPKISWNEYSSYANPISGQFAEPPEISTYLSLIGEDAQDFNITNEDDFTTIVGYLGHIVGGAGTLVRGLGFLGIVSLSTPGGVVAAGGGGASTVTMVTVPATTTTLGAFAAAATGASIGGMAGYYLAKLLGIEGPAVGVMSLAGAVAGGIIGYTVVVESASLTGSFFLGLSGLGFTAIVAIVVMAYIAIIGWGKTKQVDVEFTCMPWQAPIGGEDCQKCNEDSSKPCSEYKCSSLGQACRLLNEEEENPICKSISYENNPPIISAGEVLTQGYNFLNEEVKRVEIRKNNSECVQEFTPILFTLETDEFSQCKYSFERTSTFEEMNEYPLTQTTFTDNHSFGFSMPSIDSLSVYNISGDLKEMFGDLNMYVRCQDYHGNFNINEYVVNFCVNSGPDTTAVAHGLTFTNPENGAYLKYGTTNQDVKMWVNEPAECKYDLGAGKDYDAMANSMSCKTNLEEVEGNGWLCETSLNLNEEENKFYIKCKDKPWVLTQEDVEEYGERNVNSQDFIYVLNVVKDELKIDSITPSGNLESGFEPISVTLEVKTSGGIENGESTCYYEWGGNFIQFLDTFSNEHTQVGLNLMRGNFNIPIKCEDSAGNIANGNSIFKISVDSNPPIAVRIFYEGGKLKLITNEDAKCYYDFNSCNFDLENSSSMNSIFSKEHSADWIIGQTYYIKCKDIWDNENPSCVINAEPSQNL